SATITADGFPRLHTLDVRVRSQDKLYQALAEMPLLRRLRHLRIHGATFNEKCVKILTESPGFQHLSSLAFPGSSRGSKYSQRLKDHFGERYLGNSVHG